MNKKGQKEIGAIIGLIVFLLIGIPIIGVFSSITSNIGKDQCKPIQEKLDQFQLQVNSDQLIINKTNTLLEQCRTNYTDLMNQTITRNDFEEIKGYFNITQNKVDTLNKKVDGINRIYNLYNISINNYSFAFNIILSIEFLSFMLVKNEFLQWVWSITFERKKKKDNETAKIQKN